MLDKKVLLQHMQNRQRTVEEQNAMSSGDVSQRKPSVQGFNMPRRPMPLRPDDPNSPTMSEVERKAGADELRRAEQENATGHLRAAESELKQHMPGTDEHDAILNRIGGIKARLAMADKRR